MYNVTKRACTEYSNCARNRTGQRSTAQPFFQTSGEHKRECKSSMLYKLKFHLPATHGNWICTRMLQGTKANERPEPS